MLPHVHEEIQRLLHVLEDARLLVPLALWVITFALYGPVNALDYIHFPDPSIGILARADGSVILNRVGIN